MTFEFILAMNFNFSSFLIWLSDFGLCGGSDLGTYLLVGWWGPGALAVCRALRGLPVGFLLLRCSV